MAVPSLFPEEGGLSRRHGGGGVCVAVEREHLTTQVVLNEPQRPATRGGASESGCDVIGREVAHLPDAV